MASRRAFDPPSGPWRSEWMRANDVLGTWPPPPWADRAANLALVRRGRTVPARRPRGAERRRRKERPCPS